MEIIGLKEESITYEKEALEVPNITFFAFNDLLKVPKHHPLEG
jgi:hypothetical protein